ncbi:MAG: hypothetical protein P1Q69_00560 [Candidatus Thorarchaeota archaeon]|nr:hypothetical protein [Candidatus Thorarchaeota archaeon]
MKLYDRAVSDLEIEYEDRMIDTRFGHSYVIVTGPAGAFPVVVLHGGNEYTPNTLRNILSLCDKFRVYAIETIGHPGKSAETRLSLDEDSYGEWLVDTLDGLDLESVNVFCGSYSASIAFRLAKIDPGRISKIVLVSPSGITNGSTITFLRKLLFP